MYRPLIRHQSRSTSGYVCRHCRHQLALAARQQQQARHESTSSAAANETEDQDWFNNLNSLSADYGDPQRSKRDGGEQGEQKRPNRRERELNKKRDAQASSSTALGGGGENQFEDLKTSLASRVGDRGASGGGGGGKKTETAFRREAPAGPKNVKKRVKALKADLAEAAHPLPARPRLMPEDIMARLAKEEEEEEEGEQTKKVEKPPVAVVPGGTTSVASGERQKFEDILAKLQQEVPKLGAEVQAQEANVEAADDVDIPPGLVSGAQFVEGGEVDYAPEDEPSERIEVPSFSYSPASDAVSVPPGLVSGQLKKQKEQQQQPPAWRSSEEQPEDTKLPPEYSPQRTYSFGKIRGPLSAWQKVQETQSRPEWGGSTVESAEGRKLSFNSLREADRRSPKTVVRTAGETKAWGSELSVRPASQTDEAVVAERKQEANETETRGFVASSFDKLKATLGLRLGKDKGAAMEKAEEAQLKPNAEQAQRADIGEATSADEVPHADEKEKLAFKVRKLRGPGNADYEKITRRREIRDRVRDAHVADVVRQSGKTADAAALETGAQAGTEREQFAETEGARDDASERLAKLAELRGSSTSAAPSTITDELLDATAQRQGGRKGRRAQSYRKHKVGHLDDVFDGIGKEVSNEDLAEDHQSLSEVMSSLAAAQLNGEPAEEVMPQPTMEPAPLGQIEASDIKSISASDLVIAALNIEQPPVPPLQYGLDRVLFNPGVYQLQDPHSRAYNFDPYLQQIMPVAEFDFNALKEYKTSSQDVMLSSLAKEHGKKFVGSTSSMTGTLSHFHYLISNWRDINLNMLSRGFQAERAVFTNINKTPNAIFLRWKNGTYAIDADKEYDGANVLMMLGKSMEKLLTLPKEGYERYRKGSSNPVTAAQEDEPESFEYTTFGNFLMRSQLDAYDARLPGNGMFDLKTRAVVSIRMDTEDYESMLGYEIHTLQGNYESYEREYYDMLRSTMLKYMLQARMGRMDGIFVAYHNVERIFGFQYLPIAEIDRAMHGQVNRCLGDQEFRSSLKMMDEVLDMATTQFPEQSLRVHFETVEKPMNMMWIFAEPMEEVEIERIQSTSKAKVAEFERKAMGIEKEESAAIPEQVSTDSSEEAAADAPSESTESEMSGTTIEEAMTKSPSTPASDYTSTSSSADPKFYDQISAQQDENLKPLFAATIICQNFVNGESVPDNRPVNLKRDDKWEIQYILKEAQLSLAEKWARYEDCKTRRRITLSKYPDSEEGEENGVGAARETKKESYYMRNLRDMAQKGREFRGRMNELEVGREKVVVGDGLARGEVPVPEGPAAVPQTMSQEKQEGVGDVAEYMRWLYKY